MYLASQPGLKPGTHGLTVAINYLYSMILACPQSLSLAYTRQ